MFVNSSGSSKRLAAAMRLSEYRVIIEAQPPSEGGGFLATDPDLPGCMSDGGTREQAAHNIEDAIP